MFPFVIAHLFIFTDRLQHNIAKQSPQDVHLDSLLL